jgi:hypothetical protein
MVPATMCRTAMVAVLCAVVAVSISMLVPQLARADEPVPLGQTAPSDAQPSNSGSDISADASTSGDPAVDDWFTDDFWADASPWDGWSWSSDERRANRGAVDAAGDATPVDTPPDADAPTATLLADATTLAVDTLAAPVMSVSGTKISWPATSGVSSYVFVRKIPGQAPQYSIVTGTSVTPPAVPGETVSYGLRTNVPGSEWADEVTITYPDASPQPSDPPTAVDTQAPLRLFISGETDMTVAWNAVPGVSTYVFVRKIPGQAPQYSLITGRNWYTPPIVPGQTVSYGARTNVPGSAWTDEVTITYPASRPTTPPPTTTPPPPTTPQPIDTSFQMGVVAGSAHQYELRFLQALGARTARIDFGVGTSAASLASDVDAYARAGIRPLLLATFYGRVPSTAEAQNLANWAKAYGPGGTFWQGKSYPANTAVTDIELGNETSYSYQFGDNSLGTYSARAQSYAQRARDAANAIRAANPRVGLLAIGDNAVNQTAWMTNMLKAVPNLDDLVAGWTVHPYGPNWASRVDSTVNSAKSLGARDVPIWITEWGLSSDNGRCLSDNYGFDKCMTYSAAASTLHSALAGLQSRYGSRLGAFYLYQAHDQYPSGSQSGREAFFGAVQSNGATKGAYTSEVKADLAAN